MVSIAVAYSLEQVGWYIEGHHGSFDLAAMRVPQSLSDCSVATVSSWIAGQALLHRILHDQ